MVVHRPAGRVAEDHRRGGGVQGVAHRRRRHVGEVNQHAQPVHLCDNVAPEVGEPTHRRLVGGRVGPRGVLVVGERQVPHAQPVQRPQHPERLGDAVPALGAEQRRHPARGERRLDRVGGQRQLQVGVAGDQRVDDLDLLEDGGHRGVSGQVTRHVDGPELGPDPAIAEPPEVGVQPRLWLAEVDAFGDRARVGSLALAQRPR
jgi:hypothetical protein